MREVFFDNNATTKPLSEVANIVTRVMRDEFGNPSSANQSGNRVRDLLLVAREHVATLIGADPDEVVFTSCGTESNNMVLASYSDAAASGAIVTSTIEHSSILKFLEAKADIGTRVSWLKVDNAGRVNPEDLKTQLEGNVSLVSVQWVNNETGVIQPIEELAAICHRHKVPFHTDAAQAVGKIAMAVNEMPIDYLTFTGHKFHAPQGVGGLYRRRGVKLRPLMCGGPQESALRPGTENLPGIVGMGEAARLRRNRFREIDLELARLRDRFETAITSNIAAVKVNGDSADRVSNTSNILFHGVDGQALVARLDQAGIRVSQSSACTSQRPEPSYVLRAMGLTEQEAYSSVRFSFSILNTVDEIDCAVRHIIEICSQLRRFTAGSGGLESATGAL